MKKKEIKRNYIDKNDNVKKIKIIIDSSVKSFNDLFYLCDWVESINFVKFYRDNIPSMKYMFYGCELLKEINLSNFNTNSVSTMRLCFIIVAI